MTNIEHQPKPNTPDEKSPTVDDILGPEDSREENSSGIVIYRLGKESLVQFFVPMTKKEADELKYVAAITKRKIRDIAFTALRNIIEELKKASDWGKIEQAYRQRMEPFLPPLSESQKDSASPAELSD